MTFLTPGPFPKRKGSNLSPLDPLPFREGVGGLGSSLVTGHSSLILTDHHGGHLTLATGEFWRGLATHWNVLTPLTIPDFRRLWLANTVWWQARWMEQISIGWLVLEMTNSPGQVALVGFYRSAPYLIFGFFMGALTDRFGYRRTILFAQTLSLSVIGTLFVLLWAGHLRLWHVAVGAFLIGTSWTLDWPARQALVPDLVGKEQTLDALMINNFSQNLSSIAGPFVGGVLLDTFDVQGCFLALIVLYLIGLAALSRLAVRSGGGRRAARIVSPWGDLKESLRYIRGNERITAVLLITVFMNALAFPYQTLLPVFARDVLHRGPLGLGVLGASVGIGSFIGVLIVNWAKQFRRSGWVFAGGSLLVSTALILFAASKSYPLSVAILICGGMGMAGFSVMQTSILLVSSSDAMRSRVMGALVLAIGGGPPGNLQIGALTTLFGAPLALGISCGVAVAAVAGTTMAFPGFRAQDGRADRVKAGVRSQGSVTPVTSDEKNLLSFPRKREVICFSLTPDPCPIHPTHSASSGTSVAPPTG